ncbi:hypothetical protein HPP92_023848 [Vanilla planifolia]|uniref:Uncharacterized protein n=1 Tax=Vanilla planifolia TaxID=51239 RepID=A0A835PNI8_VANPL|nr:hypothetical protein HPP92_024226 [Vanilla planifolia]KAG0456060.1 hypothetical protein HPP92_023848 [Vanilla planifolia]
MQKNRCSVEVRSGGVGIRHKKYRRGWGDGRSQLQWLPFRCETAGFSNAVAAKKDHNKKKLTITNQKYPHSLPRSAPERNGKVKSLGGFSLGDRCFRNKWGEDSDTMPIIISYSVDDKLRPLPNTLFHWALMLHL